MTEQPKNELEDLAREMLLEAGGDVGQVFMAATNAQLRDWGERTAEAAKDWEKKRDALEFVLDQYETRKEEDCFEDHGDCNVCAAKKDLCWIEETARKVRDALGEGGAA